MRGIVRFRDCTRSKTWNTIEMLKNTIVKIATTFMGSVDFLDRPMTKIGSEKLNQTQ